MSPTELDLDEILAAKPAWIGLGLVEVLAAFLAYAVPALATVPVPALLGVLLAACGVARLAHAWRIHRWKAFLGDTVVGALYVAAAIALPASGSATVPQLATIVGAWCVAVGVVGATSAVVPPPMPGRGWLLGSGLASVLLGLLALSGRALGALDVNVVAAGNLLINGVGTLIVGLALRPDLVESGAPA